MNNGKKSIPTLGSLLTVEWIKSIVSSHLTVTDDVADCAYFPVSISTVFPPTVICIFLDSGMFSIFLFFLNFLYTSYFSKFYNKYGLMYRRIKKLKNTKKLFTGFKKI